MGQHWLEDSEWQGTCFSTCYLYNSVFIEGPHKFMLIFLIFSDFGFKEVRNGNNFKIEKLAYRTKGKFNEILDYLHTHLLYDFCVAFEKAYPSSLSLAFF